MNIDSKELGFLLLKSIKRLRVKSEKNNIYKQKKELKGERYKELEIVCKRECDTKL